MLLPFRPTEGGSICIISCALLRALAVLIDGTGAGSRSSTAECHREKCKHEESEAAAARRLRSQDTRLEGYLRPGRRRSHQHRSGSDSLCDRESPSLAGGHGCTATRAMTNRWPCPSRAPSTDASRGTRGHRDRVVVAKTLRSDGARSHVGLKALDRGGVYVVEALVRRPSRPQRSWCERRLHDGSHAPRLMSLHSATGLQNRAA
jgi:hypothetical protein